VSFGPQVVHVFAGDLRRFWPALLGLGAVIAFHRLEGLPVRRLWSFGVPDGLDVFPLLYAAITVLVVQHHSVIDDRSFWNVRPITRGAILTSKLAFVGLFLLVIPVALQIQWLVELAGGGDAWPAALDSLLYQGAFLALVALGAAVTRNVADFLTLALAVWIGTAIITGLGEWPFYRLMADDVVASRAYVERCVWLVIGIGLLVLHYRSPRALRTAVVGTGLLIGAMAVVHTAWIDLVPSPLEPAERTPYASAERIDLRAASLSAGIGGGLGGEPSAVALAGLVAEGADGATVTVGRTRSTLRSPQRMVSLAHPSPESRRSAFASVLYLDVLNGGVRIDGAAHVGWLGRAPGRFRLFVPVAVGGAEEIEALRDTRSISLEVVIDVFEPRLSTKLPDAPAVLALRGGALTIDRVERARGSVRFTGTFRRPVGALSSRSGGDFVVAPAGDIVLFNGERREYLLGVPVQNSTFEARAPQYHLVGGSWLFEQGIDIVFDPRSWRREDDRPIPDDWFEEAEPYLVDPGYAGSFSRSLELDIDAWPELDGPPVIVDPPPA
jgi:hypothetical protein